MTPGAGIPQHPGESKGDAEGSPQITLGLVSVVVEGSVESEGAWNGGAPRDMGSWRSDALLYWGESGGPGPPLLIHQGDESCCTHVMLRGWVLPGDAVKQEPGGGWPCVGAMAQGRVHVSGCCTQ